MHRFGLLCVLAVVLWPVAVRGFDVSAGQHRILDGSAQSVITGNAVRVGYFGSPTLSGATLSVLNGATILASRLNAGSAQSASTGTFTRGSVFVDGSGSAISLQQEAIIGYNGSGTLVVSNGAKFSTQAFSQWGAGLSVGYGFPGQNSQTAFAKVTDPASEINLTGMLTVGYQPGTSTVEIRNGGRLVSRFNPSHPYPRSGIVGTSSRNGGPNGVVLIDGAGSIWQQDGQCDIGLDFVQRGGSSVSQAPRGQVTLSNGGQLSCRFLRLGGADGPELYSIGTVTLESGARVHVSEALGLNAGRIVMNGGQLISGGSVRIHGMPLITSNEVGLFAGKFSVAGELMLSGAAQFDMSTTTPILLQAGSLRFLSNSSGDAKLDLGVGGMSLNYTGSTSIAQATTDIIRGRAGGTWTGPGITSATAAANPNTHAVGIAEASETGLTSLFGESFDNTTVIVRYTLPGDATLDGTVNITDFANLAANFNQSGRWFTGDFDYSGTTNIADFALLAQNFNQSLPASRSTVPEPAVAVGALFVIASLRRRAV